MFLEIMQKITQTKLNQLLDLVYDLQDNSEGVSKDLEKIISNLVSHVEDMIDFQDDLMEAWI